MKHPAVANDRLEPRAVVPGPDAAGEKAEGSREDNLEILRRLTSTQSGSFKDPATRRAALNLMEDTVAAREAAKREGAGRRRAEEDLATELAATKLLQNLSAQLIR